jgi:ABC-type Na+ efflux pump permease subunit
MEGVVDGLPLYCDTDFAGPSSHSSITSGFGSSGALSSDLTETDSIFRKKPQLEDIVAKFFKSTVHHKYHSSDTSVKSTENSPKRSTTSRVGIDGKSYQDLNDSDVIKRVKVKEDLCDILQTTSDIGNLYFIFLIFLFFILILITFYSDFISYHKLLAWSCPIKLANIPRPLH